MAVPGGRCRPGCTFRGGRTRRAAAARRPGARYRAAVARLRRCSRSGCTNPAVATLTFAYADSTAVVGPLATAAEPHSYDLCSAHAQGLTAPKGWEVVRPDEELADAAARTDDLEALANAVREAGRAERTPEPVPTGTGRRGHLRVLRTPQE
jgi:hypothetical protein